MLNPIGILHEDDSHQQPEGESVIVKQASYISNLEGIKLGDLSSPKAAGSASLISPGSAAGRMEHSFSTAALSKSNGDVPP